MQRTASFLLPHCPASLRLRFGLGAAKPKPCARQGRAHAVSYVTVAMVWLALLWFAIHRIFASGPDCFPCGSLGFGTVVDVPRLQTAPTLDGDLQEWSTIPTILLDATTAAYQEGVPPYPSPADASMRLQLAWDDTHLYLAARVFDDSLVNDSGVEVWKDDEIETGFDGNHNLSGPDANDHQYTFSPDGRTTDFAIPASLDAAIVTLADGWVVEAAMPLSAFQEEAITPGKIIGFTFGLRDDDDGGTWDQKMIWQGTAINEHWQQFGRLRLVSNLPVVTVVLSYGVNGYTGATDAWINSAQPAANYSNDDLLELSAAGQANSLLRFDLSRLPDHALIQGATLRLETQQRSNASGLDAAVYRLRRSWQPDAVTWLQASAGDLWQSPGGAGQLDRDPTLVSLVRVDALFSGYDWDVTTAVQDWYAHPESNDGLLLTGLDGPQTTYTFHSAQSTNLDRRPKLILDYVLLPITPTPTVTPSPSETASATPTGSATPTITATITETPDFVTETSTATPKPPATPSPTSTETPTDSATPTFTPSVTSTVTPAPTSTPTPQTLATELAIPAACGLGSNEYTAEGDTRSWPARVSRYSCRSGWPETGPEAIYFFSLSEKSDLAAQINYDGALTDLDLFLLAGANPENCLTGEDAAIITSGLPAGSYYLVIDGYQDAAGPYHLQLACAPAVVFSGYLPLYLRN